MHLKLARNPMSHFPGEMYEFDARASDSLVAIRITVGRISRYAIVRLRPKAK